MREFDIYVNHKSVSACLFHFRIVVSAPYGQAVGTQLPRSITATTNIQGTGVIYTCRLTPSVCVGLTGDGGGHDRRLYDVDGWYFAYVRSSYSSISCNSENAEVSLHGDGNQTEEKRGQFFGATLKSSGDTFLVRYFMQLWK